MVGITVAVGVGVGTTAGVIIGFILALGVGLFPGMAGGLLGVATRGVGFMLAVGGSEVLALKKQSVNKPCKINHIKLYTLYLTGIRGA